MPPSPSPGEQLSGWEQRLAASGATYSQTVDAPYGHVLSFKDPDGIALEFFVPDSNPDPDHRTASGPDQEAPTHRAKAVPACTEKRRLTGVDSTSPAGEHRVTVGESAVQILLRSATRR